MRPLSPLYFIKNNRARCVLLIFMMIFVYLPYAGGLYVTNPYDNFSTAVKYSENEYVMICPIADCDDWADRFISFSESLMNEKGMEASYVSNANYLSWNTIMGYESGGFTFVFPDCESFFKYCSHMGIKCDRNDISDGSMIMSRRFAANRGMKIGSTISKDDDLNIYGNYTLDYITDEEGYTLYFVDENIFTSDLLNCPNLIIYNNGRDRADVISEINAFSEEKGISVRIGITWDEDISKQFTSLYVIYYLIIVLASLILTVTINAVFVGVYQKREYEFALYNAIGITKGEIVRKIVSEIFLMYVTALIAGGVLFFTGLYLLNNLVLYPEGKYLRYFEIKALTGLIISSVLVTLPVIITRTKRLLKADIKDY